MKIHEKKEAMKLLKKGYSQKMIATKVGVTEKTVSKWVKHIKKGNLLRTENIELLEKRLNKMLLDSSSNINDIKELVLALDKLRG